MCPIEIPSWCAFCRNAPAVRLNILYNLATGVFALECSRKQANVVRHTSAVALLNPSPTET